jgi:inner membrane protein
MAGALMGAVLAPNAGVAAVVGGIAALLPDVDEPTSTLGSKIPVLSAIFRLVFGHRGITHTAIFAVLVSCLAWPLSGYFGLSPAKCALTLFLSVLSHVALDSLTPHGTEALWPVKKRFSGPIHTGSVLEWPVAAFLGGLLWLALKGTWWLDLKSAL